MKEVKIIPATIDKRLYGNSQKVLRVASYSRVSTNFEEQLSSFELQRSYYTDLILKTKGWILAGTYADEGISGTTEKRPDFLKMMRHCEKGKIDFIITKSISRFSRDIEVTMRRVRKLKDMGIGVYFEKENLNTLEENSEFTLMILASVAQEESNSISLNIRRAKQMSMERGKVNWNYSTIYGYTKGVDGEPKVVTEQGKIIKRMFAEYLKGASERAIADTLNKQGIKTQQNSKWSKGSVSKILQNERYCGEVVLQKTYVENHRTKKVKINNGQFPKYHILNNHTPIVTTEIFYATQNERARRNSIKKVSEKTITDKGRYSSKYGLTEKIVCSCCGSPYRRYTWYKKLKKKDADGNYLDEYETVTRIVWRCVKRVEHGTKYCNESVTLHEENLHTAIAKSIEATADRRCNIIEFVSQEVSKTLLSKKQETFDLVKAENRIDEITNIIADLMKGEGLSENIQMITALNSEAVGLKELADEHKAIIGGDKLADEIRQLEDSVEEESIDFGKYDDLLARQLIKKITLKENEMLEIHYKNGVVHNQAIDLKLK